jgi:two-component system, OmpR family, aerobic respiration control sensor histidine kinase ArcB
MTDSGGFVSNTIQSIAVFLDLDCTITWANQHACDFYGFPLQSLMGKNYLDICHTRQLVIPEALRPSLIDINISAANAKQEQPDPAWEVIHLHNESCEKTHFGHLVLGHFLGEKQLGSKVKLIDNLVKTMVSILPGNFWWKDLQGRYLGCDKSVLNSIGLDNEEAVIGKTDYELPWVELADKLVQGDKKVLESKQAITIEENVFTPSGEVKNFLVTKAPLLDAMCNVIGTVGMSVDTTKRAELEDELKQAIRESESANKVKNEFIANMSHDLRTPMTGVMGVLTELDCIVADLRSVLQEEPGIAVKKVATLAGQMEKYVSIAQKSADELLVLFNEILESIRLESGAIEEGAEHFILHHAIERSAHLLGATADQKGLELSITVDAGVPKYVHGKRRSLERALVNLVSNALKFTASGSVIVTAGILAQNTAKVGDTVMLQLCVKDTGVGIPKDKFEKIFENFSRLTSSYQGVFKGSGLGLYAVKRYVENLQGKISVDSTVGIGTRFTLDIPFVVSDHSDQAEQLVASSRKKSSGVVFARILVVEDNATAALVVAGVLKRLGCVVDHAKTGNEAVEMALNNSYDLIFMDIGLPDISGLTVTKKIRNFANDRNAQVPIVALTGHVDKREVCTEVGMQDLILKPAQSLILEAMIDKYAQPKETQAGVIDWNGCLQVFDGDEAMTREIVKMCAVGLVMSSAILEKAYKERNFETIRQELHKVRGGVCYLKLPQLESALKHFHELVRVDPEELEAVGKSYESLRTAITSFLSYCQETGLTQKEAEIVGIC